MIMEEISGFGSYLAFTTAVFFLIASYWDLHGRKAYAGGSKRFFPVEKALLGIGFGLLFVGFAVFRLLDRLLVLLLLALLIAAPAWAGSPRCQDQKPEQVEVIVLEGLPSTATKDRVERAATASAEDWPEGTSLNCLVVMAIAGDMEKQATKRAKSTRCPLAVVFGHRSRESATTRATYSSAERQVLRLPGSGEEVEEASVALCAKVAP